MPDLHGRAQPVGSIADAIASGGRFEAGQQRVDSIANLLGKLPGYVGLAATTVGK